MNELVPHSVKGLSWLVIRTQAQRLHRYLTIPSACLHGWGKEHHSLSLSLAYVSEAGHERCGSRTWEYKAMTQKHLHTSRTTRHLSVTPLSSSTVYFI